MRSAAAALLFAASSSAAACTLDVLDAAGGARLERVPLLQRSFALAYRHSVSLRRVESRYIVRGDAIVQTAEIFDEHGPGMSSEPLPGERLQTVRDASGARFVLHMARPVSPLVVRLHEAAAFELVAGARTLRLDPLGAPAVELRPDCAQRVESPP